MVALIVVARVRRKATIAGVLGGALTYLVSLVAAVAAGVGFWAALVAIRPAYADTGPFLGGPLFYEIAVGVLAFAVTTLVVSLLRRRPGWCGPVRRRPARAGAAPAALAVVAPGSVFLLAWPVVGLALGLTLVLLAGERLWLAVPLLVLGAAPAVALLIPFAVASYGVAEVSDGLAVAVFVLVGVPIGAALSALPSPARCVATRCRSSRSSGC